MTTLTRRRDPHARKEGWLIYYGDVRIGAIRRRSGNPPGSDPWSWSCGFYPGSEPGDSTGGIAADFDQARDEFERAWAIFLKKRTDADFEAWRRDRASTAWKYAMWDAGCRLPTQMADGQSRCFCGAEITIADTHEHIYAAHMGHAG